MDRFGAVFRGSLCLTRLVMPPPRLDVSTTMGDTGGEGGSTATLCRPDLDCVKERTTQER